MVKHTILRGPHDDICCAVKQIYSDVSTQKVLNEDAHNLVIYANTSCNIKVYYLDQSEINFFDVSDSVYIPGILEIYHVVRKGENSFDNSFIQFIHIKTQIKKY